MVGELSGVWLFLLLSKREERFKQTRTGDQGRGSTAQVRARVCGSMYLDAAHEVVRLVWNHEGVALAQHGQRLVHQPAVVPRRFQTPIVGDATEIGLEVVHLGVGGQRAEDDEGGAPLHDADGGGGGAQRLQLLVPEV